LRGGLEDFEGKRLEKSGEVNRDVSEEKGDELETITFSEGLSLEVSKEFPLSSKI